MDEDRATPDGEDRAVLRPEDRSAPRSADRPVPHPNDGPTAGPSRGIRVLTLFGIPVRLDPSWFLVFALVAWSLATGWFPMRDATLAPGTLWALGVVGALGLFASIVVHEFAHSLVARREGVRIRSITLFLFGGVAEMEKEPPGPGAEARIAIAGPLASVVLAGLCALAGLALTATVLRPAALVFEYLAVINAVLVVFNLVPAFPMDGGRVFRAWLWKRSGDLGQATRRAARMGSTFGAVLIGLGILSGLQGDLIGGIWLAFVGLFVRRAAAGSVQQTLIQRTLGGAPVRRFAVDRVVSVDAAATVQSLVDDAMLRHHHEFFPVLEEGELVGAVSTAEVRTLPRERWPATRVDEVMVPLDRLRTLAPDDDALDALSWMAHSGRTRMLVVEGSGRLVGLLTLKDLLSYLQIALDLGVDGP